MKKLRLVFLLLFVLCICAKVPCQEIHEAVEMNDLTLVRNLVERNPELVNAQDAEGRTPLYLACMSKPWNSELIALLIEKGADVNAKNKQGVGILLSTVWSRNKEAAQILLSKGADVNAEDRDGNTSLWWASNIRFYFYSKDMLELLISNGARIPEDKETLRMMLHSAAFHGHKKFVELLIENGADVKSKNHNDGTFLHSASAGGLQEFVELMSKEGADLNKKNRYGLTPLHMAATRGQRDTCQLLLEKGADIHATSIEGKTAYHYALECEFQEVAEYLTAMGADKRPPRFPVLRGEYLGQTKPGLIPELFAPGIVSTIYYEHTSITFSPDGKEIYWSPEFWNPFMTRILVTQLINNEWTSPQVASFSGENWDSNPSFSSDGKKLYFTSARSAKSGVRSSLWVVDKKNNGWQEPKPLYSLVSSNRSYQGSSVSKNGNLYFSSRQEDSYGERDIYRSLFIDGHFSQPENLGDAVNSESYDAFPYIAPDEQYLLFESSRPGGYGGPDIYISFRRRDGSWTNAVNLGEKINGKGEERFASVSPDGEFLFFSSDRNGNMDIYWVDAKLIEPLRLGK